MHELFNMFMHILDNHRYLVIVGDLNTPHELKYQTDIFSKDPIPNQTIFFFAEEMRLMLVEGTTFKNDETKN